jgi:hydrogenase nickel incorporation protein HypA/HybF
MHELSIATDLVNTALKTAQDNNAKKVMTVTVEVGELAMINPEQLEFMYDILVEDNMLKGSKLNIIKVPAVADCDNCGYKGPVEDKFACTCPKCSLTLKIKEGRDICLKNMELEI